MTKPEKQEYVGSNPALSQIFYASKRAVEESAEINSDKRTCLFQVGSDRDHVPLRDTMYPHTLSLVRPLINPLLGAQAVRRGCLPGRNHTPLLSLLTYQGQTDTIEVFFDNSTKELTN